MFWLSIFYSEMKFHCQIVIFKYTIVKFKSLDKIKGNSKGLWEMVKVVHKW